MDLDYVLDLFLRKAIEIAKRRRLENEDQEIQENITIPVGVNSNNATQH